MAAAVYSTRFDAKQTFSGTSTLVVPDGFRAILRDLDVFFGEQALPAELRLNGDLGQGLYVVTNTIGTPSCAQWRGRQVVNPGESFSVTVSGGGNADYALSGYLLTLP